MRTLSRPLGRGGQILVPSLFVLPSLFLLVYLVFETAKLSREKIRHQFAVDAAAFVEMTNYSDFLNRSAYVNGAFPMRIFEEGFKTTMIDRKNNTVPRSLYDILYENGVFPRTDQGQPLDPYPQWLLQFGGPNAGDKNSNPPTFPTRLDIITMQNAIDYWLSWDDAQDIYKLYVQIYQLLGSVEDAQYSVFKRLTSTHNFFRKSYWLNTGDPINQPEEGSSYFPALLAQPYCIEEVMIYGNKPTSNPFQPYQIYAPVDPIRMDQVRMPGCSPAGLFQVMSVKDTDLRKMSRYTAPGGVEILQHWPAPTNYFNVDFNGLVPQGPGGVGPWVHATITLDGGYVWPNPTPKFQTRLFP